MSDKPERLLEIRCPALPNQLKLVREAISRVARECGFSEEGAYDLVLALDEACQNIVRYAYVDGPPGDILLEVYQGEGELLLRLIDSGKKVDKSMWRPRDLDDIRPGGLGTYFLQTLMDSVEYETPPTGYTNLLAMRKRIA